MGLANMVFFILEHRKFGKMDKKLHIVFYTEFIFLILLKNARIIFLYIPNIHIAAIHPKKQQKTQYSWLNDPLFF
jgi:hypothetical protein